MPYLVRPVSGGRAGRGRRRQAAGHRLRDLCWIQGIRGLLNASKGEVLRGMVVGRAERFLACELSSTTRPVVFSRSLSPDPPVVVVCVAGRKAELPFWCERIDRSLGNDPPAQKGTR